MSFNYFEAPGHVTTYNQFRVSPPEELVRKMVDYLTEKCTKPLTQAVDVGCGGGQSTQVLSPFFETVVGIDPSNEQIADAQSNNNISNIVYRSGSAESIDLPNDSVQLITAGQACHWFDLPKFYAEAERILTPNGVLALYGYLLPRPSHGVIYQQLCDLVDKYYNVTLGKYVLPGSKLVYLENYRGDDFCVIPFVTGPMIRDDSIFIVQDATLADLIGYISSWSAFQNYQKLEGKENAAKILKAFEKEFLDTIGSTLSPQDIHIKVEYKFFLLMGRKD